MSGQDALIGFTGLVGSNLQRQREFDLLVNSRNGDWVRGGTFNHVVFSAARAEKWRANAAPAADAEHIDSLIELLGSFRTERLTLISTVDVFGAPRGVDETSPVKSSGLHAYGAGRHRLEEAAIALHERVMIVRLPALFGPGLKKNVVYDLLHDNQVDRIQPASRFQYFDLERLADDLDLLWDEEVPLVHLVTEPLQTGAVALEFQRDSLPHSESPVVEYDVRTTHSALFGRRDGYIEDAASVLKRLGCFARREALR